MKMRLLILLSFLGSWSIIGSDNSPKVTPTIATKNNATETKQTTADPGIIQGNASTSAPSSGSILTTNQLSTSSANPNQTQSVTKSTVPSSQSNRTSTTATAQNNTISPTLGSTSPTVTDHNSKLEMTATSGVKNNTAVNITTAAKPVIAHAVGTPIPPSSSTRGSASASASSKPKSTIPSGKPTATPNQGLPTTVPTSTPTSVSVAKSNAPTKSKGVPKATTERTKGSSVETVTSATGKVKNITMSKAQVKDTTGMMQTNAVSSAFTDGTGHSVKSTSSNATTNATDGPPGAASTTLKHESNISSTAYCVKESSKQNYYLPIQKDMNCETFLTKKGNDVANDICSTLVKTADLRGLNKCEVQFSPEKEHPDQLNIEVSFKVSDNQMKDVLQKMQKAMKQELHREYEENQQREKATELKKLIAMVVTGSLLLLVFLAAIVYRCSQRKSKHKDPYLTEELRTVDNGCHDNPGMDITERESEMEEKNNSKATYLENNDGWIVPMDTHIKNDVEEEDTHL